MAGKQNNKPEEDAYENEGGALPELVATEEVRPTEEVTGEVHFTDKSLYQNKERLNTVAEDYVRGMDFKGREVKSVEVSNVRTTQKVNVHADYKVQLA